MADDLKKQHNTCTKITDQMKVDLHRICAVESTTPAEYIFKLMRGDMYGRSMRAHEIIGRITSAADPPET